VPSDCVHSVRKLNDDQYDAALKPFASKLWQCLTSNERSNDVCLKLIEFGDSGGDQTFEAHGDYEDFTGAIEMRLRSFANSPTGSAFVQVSPADDSQILVNCSNLDEACNMADDKLEFGGAFQLLRFVSFSSRQSARLMRAYDR
jgi:hypothetical protein